MSTASLRSHASPAGKTARQGKSHRHAASDSIRQVDDDERSNSGNETGPQHHSRHAERHHSDDRERRGSIKHRKHSTAEDTNVHDKQSSSRGRDNTKSAKGGKGHKGGHARKRSDSAASSQNGSETASKSAGQHHKCAKDFWKPRAEWQERQPSVTRSDYAGGCFEETAYLENGDLAEVVCIMGKDVQGKPVDHIDKIVTPSTAKTRAHVRKYGPEVQVRKFTRSRLAKDESMRAAAAHARPDALVHLMQERGLYLHQGLLAARVDHELRPAMEDKDRVWESYSRRPSNASYESWTSERRLYARPDGLRDVTVRKSKNCGMLQEDDRTRAAGAMEKDIIKNYFGITDGKAWSPIGPKVVVHHGTVPPISDKVKKLREQRRAERKKRRPVPAGFKTPGGFFDS